MPSNTSRRQFLATGAGTSLLALGGCLSGASDDESATTTTNSPDERRTDDLYVNNTDGAERRVAVRLEPVGDDASETVHDEKYLLPGSTRVRVPDVGEEGDAYDLTVSVNGEQFTETWDVRTCDGTEAPKGNRDAEVRIDDGDVEFRENACDAIFVESRPASDHTEYRVDGTQTTDS